MKNTKQSLTIAALIIALIVGFGLLFDRTTQKATAAPAPPAVVILQTSGSATLLTNIVVTASDSSASAPTVAAGSGAAQALADLLAAGFSVQHVDAIGFGGAQYTLVK